MSDGYFDVYRSQELSTESRGKTSPFLEGGDVQEEKSYLREGREPFNHVEMGGGLKNHEGFLKKVGAREKAAGNLLPMLQREGIT